MTSPAGGVRAAALTSLDRVRAALETATGRAPRFQGGQWMAFCPLGQERTPSLAVKHTSGRTILHCHSCGEDAAAHVEAMGLGMADLFDADREPAAVRSRTGRSPQQRRAGARRGRLGPLPAPIAGALPLDAEHTWQVTRRYDYADATGEVVQVVLREECNSCQVTHKSFRQRYRSKAGGDQARKPAGFVAPLYRLPQVLQQVATGGPVWLLEGEKDVETAEQHGLVATTNTQGAKNFPVEGAEALRGGSVRVVVDRDTPGYQRGVALWELLEPVAGEVILLRPAVAEPGADLSDHLQAGLPVSALEVLHVSEVQAWALLSQASTQVPRVQQTEAEVTAQMEAHEAAPGAVSRREREYRETGAAVSKAAARLRALPAGEPSRERELQEGLTAAEHAFERAQAGVLHRTYARRWAHEASIRFEVLLDLLHQAQRAAESAATESLLEAVEVLRRRVEDARVAAVTATDRARQPVPDVVRMSVTTDPDARPTSVPTPTPPTLVAATAGPTPEMSGPEMSGSEMSGLDAGSPGDLVGEVPAEASPGSGSWDVGVAPVQHGRSGLVSSQQYRIVEGQIVALERGKRDEDDDKLKVVLGLDCRLTRLEYQERATDDDADEVTLHGREPEPQQAPLSPLRLIGLLVTYTDPDSGEAMYLRVSVDEWRDGSWLDALPGPPAYQSTPSGLAKVRDGIKAVSGSVPAVQLPRATGWRRDEATGTWRFLHARGAITAAGHEQSPVRLTGALSRYDLPIPTTDSTTLRQAFLCDSAGLMDVMPDRVAVPLLGHVYRAALSPSPFVLALVGVPGTFKTSIAALAMHHWGERWDRRHPGVSMSGNGDTLNALRIKLNAAKDVMFWADDVAPTKDWTLAQRNLEEFARLIHNAEARGRSTRDGQEVLDGTRPRTSAIVTSEVSGRPGSSGSQRLLPLPLIKADFPDPRPLFALHEDTSRYGRALLQASFLSWLAGNLDEVRQRGEELLRAATDELVGTFEDQRLSEALAQTWVGWVTMTDFLVDRGALTSQERDDVLQRVQAALHAAGDATRDPDTPTTAGGRIRELLAHALEAGIAHAEDVQDGGCPGWPLAKRLGWRRSQMSEGNATEAPRYRLDPRGVPLGWVKGEAVRQGGGRELLLTGPSLEHVMKAVAREMTDVAVMDVRTAVQALHLEGLLATESNGDGPPRLQVQRMIPCLQGRRRVIAIDLDRLLGDEPDEPTRPDPQPHPDLPGPADPPSTTDTPDTDPPDTNTSATDAPDADAPTDGAPAASPEPEAVDVRSRGAETDGPQATPTPTGRALPLAAGLTSPEERTVMATRISCEDCGQDVICADYTTTTAEMRVVGRRLLDPDPVTDHQDALPGTLFVPRTVDGDVVAVAVTAEQARTHTGPVYVTHALTCDLRLALSEVPDLTRPTADTPTNAAASSNHATGQPSTPSTPQQTSTAPAPARAPAPDSTPASPAAAPPAKGAGGRPSKARTATTGRATPGAEAEFRAAVAVADVSGVWLPDGSREPLPPTLTHVGHLARLVEQLNLGSRVARWRVEPGQVWITGALLEQLDVDTSDLPEWLEDRTTEIRDRTTGHPIISGALAEGWSVSKPGDCLSSWTRVWREGEGRGVFIVALPGVDDDLPVMRDLNQLTAGPEPQTRTDGGDDTSDAAGAEAGDAAGSAGGRWVQLARRLQRFADATGTPWQIGGAITGLELAKSLRAKDIGRMFSVQEPVLPATWSVENDLNWSRVPSESEAARMYVHGYDRGGSHPAATAGLDLGIGAAEHHPEGRRFDPRTPGYWKVAITGGAPWQMPHPLLADNRVPEYPTWVTTPTLQVAIDLDYLDGDVEVLEAYTWPQKARVLDPWYERIRDARTDLQQVLASREVSDATAVADAQAALGLLKQVYTRSVGMLGSETYQKGRPTYQPAWRHHIVAKSRANILRRVAQIGRDSGQWPVAIVTDTLFYVSDDADPVTAWPGRAQDLGTGFGKFKAEVSGLLAPQLSYLEGDGYAGKSQLEALLVEDEDSQ